MLNDSFFKTYGAHDCKHLGIPGENLRNCIEARKIVGWYNGVPTDADLNIDLSGETVAIFGQGNVAIDVARILLTPVDHLKVINILFKIKYNVHLMLSQFDS